MVRVHGLNAPKNAYKKWIVELAEKMLPNSNVVEYTFGLLDIGAFYCKRSKMKCNVCCVGEICTFAESRNNNVNPSE